MSSPNSVSRLIAICSIGVLAFVVIALSVDVASVLNSEREISGTSFFAIFMTTCFWASLIAMAVAMVATASWLLGRLAHRVAKVAILRTLPLALVIAFLVSWVGQSLLTGPRMVSHPDVVVWRILAWVLPFLISPLLMHGTRLWFMRTYTRPARLVVLLGVFVVIGVTWISLWVDQTQYPGRYPLAHLLLWGAVLFCCGLLGVLLAPLNGGCAFSRAFVLLAVIATAAPITDFLGWDPGARADAFAEAPFLSKVLSHFLPPPPTEKMTVDEAFFAKISAESLADPERMDQVLPHRRELNVLLLTIDALRPDRITKELAPNLWALKNRSTNFDNAWTTHPATRLAFLSAMRGRYPTATDGYQELLSPGSVAPEDRQMTMAKMFAEAGRRCEAITGFPYRLLRNEFQVLGRDFQDTNLGNLGEQWRSDRITDGGLEAIDRIGEKPFFLWTHYFDPHDPVEDKGQKRNYAERYDETVKTTDREIARLIDGLAKRALLDRTLIVVHADHGRVFDSAGRLDTRPTMSEDALEVPLFFVIPGFPARQISSPVDLSDVLPTIAGIVAIDPQANFQGQSLVPYILAGDPVENERERYPTATSFAEMDYPDLGVRMFAVRDQQFKLVHNPVLYTFELYDLFGAEKERRELGQELPGELKRMKGLMGAYRLLLKTDPKMDFDLDRLSAIKKTLRSGKFLAQIRVLNHLARGQIPEELVPELFDLCTRKQDTNRRVRIQSMRLMGQLFDEESAKQIVMLMESNDTALSWEAAIAAAKRGIPVADRFTRDISPMVFSDRAIQRTRLGLFLNQKRDVNRALFLLAAKRGRSLDLADLAFGLIIHSESNYSNLMSGSAPQSQTERIEPATQVSDEESSRLTSVSTAEPKIAISLCALIKDVYFPANGEDSTLIMYRIHNGGGKPRTLAGLEVEVEVTSAPAGLASLAAQLPPVRIPSGGEIDAAVFVPWGKLKPKSSSIVLKIRRP